MNNIKVSNILDVQYWINGTKKNIVRIYSGSQKIWEKIREIITDKQSLIATKYTDKYLSYNCDFSSCTDLTNSFNGNSTISNLILDNTGNVKVWGNGDDNGAFSRCPNLISVKINTDNAISFDGIFDTSDYFSYYNKNLTSIEFSTTKNVTEYHSAFRSETNLTSLKGIDFFSCVNIDAIFYYDGRSGIGNLMTFTAKNFGTQPNIRSTNVNGFNNLFNWGVGSTEAHNSVVDTLYTYSFDRAAHGYTALVVKLSSTTMNILTTAEKAAITAKGYTLTT